MKRWNYEKSAFAENPKVDAFLAEVAEVSRKHGFALSHEDGHGSFIVERMNEDLITWLEGANDASENTGIAEVANA